MKTKTKPSVYTEGKKVVQGIKLEQNPLTGTWFIFARLTNSKDATIKGTLAEMTRAAEFAAEHHSIVQD
jgi:hypothetical protein